MTSASEPDLGDLLMRATRGLRRDWAQALEPWGLTPHLARALRVVSELDSPRLGAVAERLRIAPRSATEVIDALEERGLVTRGPDPSDRRAIAVALTGEGSELLAEIETARVASRAHHFASLSADERATLAALLSKLDDPTDRGGDPVSASASAAFARADGR